MPQIPSRVAQRPARRTRPQGTVPRSRREAAEESQGGSNHEDALAAACVQARMQLRRASRSLHDDVGGLLAVAGLELQLLRMDLPEFAERSANLRGALDGVMQHVRRLSRELDPTPACRTGLKNALLDLAEEYVAVLRGGVQVRYSATAVLPPDAADALYVAVAATIASAAAGGATRVVISVTGSKGVTVRVVHDGDALKARRVVEDTARLARAANLDFDVETKKSTIVLIRYALRRSAGG